MAADHSGGCFVSRAVHWFCTDQQLGHYPQVALCCSFRTVGPFVWTRLGVLCFFPSRLRTAPRLGTTNYFFECRHSRWHLLGTRRHHLSAARISYPEPCSNQAPFRVTCSVFSRQSRWLYS